MKDTLAILAALLFASLGSPSPGAEPFSGISGDKTLVVWASPANLTQRGGSALTIDDRKSHFDAIVFGEIAPARWMGGSDFYRRTMREQDAAPAETVDADTAVQIAIVYRGNGVTLYRNGQPYSQHAIQKPQRFDSNSAVVIGLRHLESEDGACFAGAIDDARIYNVALTAQQIGELSPNQPSEPKPIAWWNFENGKPEDVLGAFPVGKLVGKARIESGKLVLDGVDSYLVTPPTVTAKPRVVTSPDVSDELALNFHLMHPGGASLPGDPNAAFCLDGVYHLHYILAHPWQNKRSFSFVHVTSPDMLHWTWQTTKLQPAVTGHGMFSGTGFLTAEGKPAAIYHGQGSGRNQIAIAKDRQLSEWQKPYPVEVRNADGTEAKIVRHWDPDCFLIGDTYYAISGGEQPPLLKSNDLKNWTYVGPFLKHDMPDVAYGEDISCPNFFQLGNKWMLLCISHPLGCRYYIGDWDAHAEQFVPETHGRMNWRRDEQSLFGQPPWRVDFFAPESLLTPDGRRVMWAWLATIGNSAGNMDNRTIQSLPRELSLSGDGNLRIKPLRELEALRGDPLVFSDITISDLTREVLPTSAPNGTKIATLGSDAVEMRITIDREQAARKLFGFTLFSDGPGGLPILLRPETGTLRVGTMEAPFAVSDLPAGEDVQLRIFIDKYLVEVFANDRQAVVASHADYAGKRDLTAFTVGAPTTIRRVEIWNLNSTNQGFRQAQQNRNWEPKTE